MDRQQKVEVAHSGSSLPVALLEMNFGAMVSACLYCAVQLGIAEQLRQGACHIDDLARATQAQPDGLLRVLRILSSYGVFQEMSPGIFTQSQSSLYLLPEYPGSIYQMILMRDDPYWWRMWENLTDCVRSGVPAFKLTWNDEFWSKLQKDARLRKLFDDTMTSTSNAVNDTLAEAYDFSQADTVVDVGGGEGSLLATILKRYPTVRGILFECAQVIEKAKAYYEGMGLLPRCEFKAGDFFTAIPEGGNIYILKAVLHDWNDEQCLKILRNCRRAMKAGGHMIAIDMLNQPDDPAPYPHMMDLHMYALFHGHERSAAEFGALYEAAGLRVTRVIPTTTTYALVEGEAV